MVKKIPEAWQSASPGAVGSLLGLGRPVRGRKEVTQLRFSVTNLVTHFLTVSLCVILFLLVSFVVAAGVSPALVFCLG